MREKKEAKQPHLRRSNATAPLSETIKEENRPIYSKSKLFERKKSEANAPLLLAMKERLKRTFIETNSPKEKRRKKEGK